MMHGPANPYSMNFYQAPSYTRAIYHYSLCGVRLGPLGTPATIWPTVPAPDDR
jgi:hypothetical protein